MAIRFALALVMLLNATPVWAVATTIRNDLGGLVIKYMLAVEATTSVKFDGYCASACTLYINVKNTCATKRAIFGFHLAYTQAPNSDYKKINYRVSTIMFESYPKWVQDWIRKKGGLARSMKIMPNDYILKHMRKC